jgi:mannose/fructose/N-acetylgalactosamine-specific phosphotransferase system component IIC
MANKPDADDEKRPPIFSRSNVLPAAGIGLITAFIADQEHAPFPVGFVVAVVVTLVVIGMLALKRGFHGD